MRVVVQKCQSARVTCQKECREISKGLLLLVGFTKGDGEKTIQEMAKKIVHLRIFEDEQGIMNESLLQVQGGILSISQFTLYADTSKGNRPSYMAALPGEEASVLYDRFNEELQKYVPVQTGFFGQHMDVSLVNVGPTTILLEK